MAGHFHKMADFYPASFLHGAGQMGFSNEPVPGVGMSVPLIQETSFHVRGYANGSAGCHVGIPQPYHPYQLFRNQQLPPIKSSSARKQVIVSLLRKRTVYSPAQLRYLEFYFQSNMYPNAHQSEQLATILHLSVSNIKTWFQNKRVKFKSQKIQSKKPPVMGLKASNIPDTHETLQYSAPSFNMSRNMTPQVQATPHEVLSYQLESDQELFKQAPTSYASANDRLVMQQTAPSTEKQYMPCTGTEGYLSEFTTIKLEDFKEDLDYRNPYTPKFPTQSNVRMGYGYTPPMSKEQKVNQVIPQTPSPIATNGHEERKNFFMPQMPGFMDSVPYC